MAIGLDVLEHGLLLVRLRTRIVEHRGPDDDLVLRPRQGADRPGSTRQRSIGRSERRDRQHQHQDGSHGEGARDRARHPGDGSPGGDQQQDEDPDPADLQR